MGGYVGVNTTLYTPVDYIQSSGTQYIDTMVFPYKTKCEVTFSVPNQPSSNGYLVAGWNANNNRYYAVAFATNYSNSFVSVLRDNASAVILGPYNNNIHTVIYNDENNKVFYDNVEKGTVSDLTTEGAQSIYLFTMHNGSGSTQEFISARLYGIKFWDKLTNTLIKDFIPALDANNVACLYDKVEDKFYYNQGTGTFGYGTTGTPIVRRSS